MQSAGRPVLHPSEDEPLAPVTLHQALVVFRVEVERCHRLQIRCAKPRRERWRRVRATEDLVEPLSTKTGKGAIARIPGHAADLQTDGSEVGATSPA
jgi:hypothetical protein